jgi:hypothetical protein
LDGERLVVSSHQEVVGGVAYLFRLGSEGWRAEGELVASDGRAEEDDKVNRLGCSIGMHREGILIGSHKYTTQLKRSPWELYAFPATR